MTRLLLAFTTLFLASCNSKNDNLTDGLFAEIETSKGKNYFEIEYQLKGKTKEVKIDASGKIV